MRRRMSSGALANSRSMTSRPWRSASTLVVNVNRNDGTRSHESTQLGGVSGGHGVMHRPRYPRVGPGGILDAAAASLTARYELTDTERQDLARLDALAGVAPHLPAAWGISQAQRPARRRARPRRPRHPGQRTPARPRCGAGHLGTEPAAGPLASAWSSVPACARSSRHHGVPGGTRSPQRRWSKPKPPTTTPTTAASSVSTAGTATTAGRRSTAGHCHPAPPPAAALARVLRRPRH